MDSEPADLFRETFEQLPSGVEISVEVSSPADGSVFPPGEILVEGFATIGESAPIPKINLTYLLDVSGSTGDPASCGGDLNGDGEADTVLDCEIAALLEVNKLAASMGTVAQVGAGVFGTRGFAADVQPGGTNADPLTAPSSNLDGLGGNDMEEVLRSIQYGEIGKYTYNRVSLQTSYAAGLEALVPTLAADPDHQNVVIMVSDGKNNMGKTVAEVLPLLPDSTVVHTFAIGNSSSCTGGQALGSLQDIADGTGGTCTEVPTVSDLPQVLPEVIAVKMSGLELLVDNTAYSVDTLEPLPLEGPAHVDYSRTIELNDPGEHTICGRVTGVDSMGTNSAQECVTIRINTAPIAQCEDLVLVTDDSCEADASIDSDSFDPDGDLAGCVVKPPGPYPIGKTEVTLVCEDANGESSQCSATVEVVNGSPPEIEVTSDLVLWPPDHTMHEFSVADCIAGLTDTCSGEIFDAHAGFDYEIVNLTSDELDNELGDGNTCEDTLMITGKTTFEVRSERSGKRNGRVYEALIRMSDAYGHESYTSCRVTVPKSHGKQAVADGCALCVDGDHDDEPTCGDCPTFDEVCG